MTAFGHLLIAVLVVHVTNGCMAPQCQPIIHGKNVLVGVGPTCSACGDDDCCCTESHCCSTRRHYCADERRCCQEPSQCCQVAARPCCLPLRECCQQPNPCCSTSSQCCAAISRCGGCIPAPPPQPCCCHGPAPRPCFVQAPAPQPCFAQAPAPHPCFVQAPAPHPCIVQAPAPHPCIAQAPAPHPPYVPAPAPYPCHGPSPAPPPCYVPAPPGCTGLPLLRRPPQILDVLVDVKALVPRKFIFWTCIPCRVCCPVPCCAVCNVKSKSGDKCCPIKKQIWKKCFKTIFRRVPICRVRLVPCCLKQLVKIPVIQVPPTGPPPQPLLVGQPLPPCAPLPYAPSPCATSPCAPSPCAPSPCTPLPPPVHYTQHPYRPC